MLEHISQIILSQAPVAETNTDWWQLLQEHTLYQLLATDRNILIIIACWLLTWFIGKMIPSKWLVEYKTHKIYGIILIICMTAMWLPGIRPGLQEGQHELATGTGISGDEIGYRFVLGIILAGGAVVIPVVLNWFIGKVLPPKLVKSIRKVLF